MDCYPASTLHFRSPWPLECFQITTPATQITCWKPAQLQGQDAVPVTEPLGCLGSPAASFFRVLSVEELQEVFSSAAVPLAAKFCPPTTSPQEALSSIPASPSQVHQDHTPVPGPDKITLLSQGQTRSHSSWSSSLALQGRGWVTPRATHILVLKYQVLPTPRARCLPSISRTTSPLPRLFLKVRHLTLHFKV